MKLPFFATGCLSVLLLASCADKRPHRPGGPGAGGAGGVGGPQANAQQMASDLGLSEDQKKKFMSAMKEHGEKMKALHGKSSLSEEEKNKQTAEARKRLGKKMHGILTPEQFKKWQEERQAMRPPGEQRGPAGPPGAGGPGAGGPPPPGPNGGTPPNRYLNSGPDSHLPPGGMKLGGDEPAPTLPPLPPVNLPPPTGS